MLDYIGQNFDTCLFGYSRKLQYTLVCVIILINSSLTYAQLSPGKLHKSHAHLENLENCTKCHEREKQLSSSKCLSCHVILKEGIDNNKGLHSIEGYEDCADCHVEHQGRDYELIFWPEDKEEFEHSQVDFPLLGAHAKLLCEKCHNATHILNKQKFKESKKNLNNTFLGLGATCISCHHEEHRGQLGDNCKECHNNESWKPAPGYDHSKSPFKLTGKHTTIECSKCHNKKTDNKFPNDANYSIYKNILFKSCVSCHRDVHLGKLGSNCIFCHETSGWKNVKEGKFDHNSTRFPLTGAHFKVRCESCHRTSNTKKVRNFSLCRDCHADYHRGQFSHRKMGGECSECHTTNTFSPTLFTINMHNKSSYQLSGSHLAVSCKDCHRKKDVKNGKLAPLSFKLESKNCNACHENVHSKNRAFYVASVENCTLCHDLSSWSSIQFDHDKTGFILEGSHKTTKCRDCHYQIKTNPDESNWIFKNIDNFCFSCHEDVHFGQFRNKKDLRTDCAICHTPQDWLAENFNHDSQASFGLKGEHQALDCSKCHKQENIDGFTFIRYKPLDSSCESCHSE